ncbi:MAG: hypothetical protein HXY20_05515 [Acidobacteria bacterium]|nr:hypothetical protein [Acidobacteriota bacterium]
MHTESDNKEAGRGSSGISRRTYGMKGTIDTQYGDNASIKGSKPLEGGSTGDLYPEGTSANIAIVHENITNRRFENATVAPSVRSNLSSILARDASHKRRERPGHTLQTSALINEACLRPAGQHEGIQSRAGTSPDLTRRQADRLRLR